MTPDEQAQALELREWEANQRRVAPPISAPSAYFCESCDEPIPEGRRLAVPGVALCVECQSDLERTL